MVEKTVLIDLQVVTALPFLAVLIHKRSLFSERAEQ